MDRAKGSADNAAAKGVERFFSAGTSWSPDERHLIVADSACRRPLIGLPEHDVQKWGAAHDHDGVQLVRLADLVRMVSARTGSHAVREVAAFVLNKVRADGECAFYWMRQGAGADRLDEAAEWSMPANYPGSTVHPLGGLWASTLDCLEWHWAFTARSFAELDEGEHAFVAVRVDDAVRCFVPPAEVLELFEAGAVSPQQPRAMHRVVSPLALVASGKATPQDREASALAMILEPDRTAKGQVSWTSKVTAENFLNGLAFLSAAGTKQAAALDLIAKKWRCGAGSSMRKRITACNALRGPQDRNNTQSAGNTR